jgi:predicted double-glycine peptidase
MTRFLFTLLSIALLSEEELRFTPVYKQGYDTSCGIAVTASLLATYWNVPVTEKELYAAMILDRMEDGAANYTVSFSTITECLQKHGVQSRAYAMDWRGLSDTLEKGFAPVIVHYAKPNPHFVLLLGMEDGYAFVADPAQGFGLAHKTVFTKNYSGNAMLTASRTAVKNTEAAQGAAASARGRLDKLRGLAHRRLR